MNRKPALRLGTLLVTRTGPHQFTFEDGSDPDLRQIVFNDVYVPELIKFLHQWSPASQRHLGLEFISEPPPPNPSVPEVDDPRR
jgi:hypothetical protein